MSRPHRVVAELGRPETPEETAARKAESSRIYRSSQSTRNLIAAMLVTLAVVAVVILAVPRGTPPERAPIDVAAVAEGVSNDFGRPVVVPDVPEDWTANRAGVEGGAVEAWTVIYVPGEDDGYLRFAQGFDADDTWPTRELRGASVDDTVDIDGITWQRWSIGDAARAGNVTGALATEAGDDTVLIYGTASAATLEEAASAASVQIRALREATR